MNALAATTYRNDLPLPFCPGCGHAPVLEALNRALVSLALDPSEVVIVSDIGCSGLSDQYFVTSAFHGLHGRSLTYATGIKLAHPELKVVVIMGDGGAGIGGAHLLNAARRNVGLTLLVLNNFNFGMTGGQHSVTTPTGAHTSTTPGGNLERPLDLCGTAAVNGAGYVYRGSNFDPDLDQRMAAAIASERFALLDVWDLCTAHFVPRNHANRKTLHEMLERFGFQAGLLHDEQVPEYAAAYRRASVAFDGASPSAPRPIAPRFQSALDRRFQVVVAGSAGGKVLSAARTVAKAAVLSGLWAAQKDDYPITVKTGHSLAGLVLAPEEVQYTGIAKPDALVLLSTDGLAKARRFLAQMDPEGHVFALPGLADVETRAHVTVVDPEQAQERIPASATALHALARAVAALGLFPFEALEETVAGDDPRYRDANLAAVRAAINAA